MRLPKDNQVYLLHIKEASEKILKYTSLHDFQYFKNIDWDQDAVFPNP